MPVFASIFVGALLTIVTVAIHALGTAWWIGQLKQTWPATTLLGKRLLPVRILCTTALILLVLHIAEVIPWALSYLLLTEQNALSSLEEAAYFATVTFASLGYGDIVISGPWRLLSAIQAMNGLLVFGWSTALLFAVVERIWGDSEGTVHLSNDASMPRVRLYAESLGDSESVQQPLVLEPSRLTA